MAGFRGTAWRGVNGIAGMRAISRRSQVFFPQLRGLGTTIWLQQRNQASSEYNPALAPEAQPVKPTQHSPLVQRLVKFASILMGGNMRTSKAIRVTRTMYLDCASRGSGRHPESRWLYETLPLAPTYQTWFALTNLHVYLLTVRLRALEDPNRPGSSAMSRLYIKELVEHFFRDIENRMIESYGVTQTRLISVYMRDLLAQYHGTLVGYDEGLVKSDAVMASAIWRNVFGAGAAVVQPGPSGKGVPDLASPDSGESLRSGPDYQVPSLGDLNTTDKEPGQGRGQHLASSAALGTSSSTRDHDPAPVYAPPPSPNASSGAAASLGVPGKSELRSWIGLCHLTQWLRREVSRMEKLDDAEIIEGRLSFAPFQTK